MVESWQERISRVISTLIMGLITYLVLRFFGKVPALNWGPWQWFDDFVMLGVKLFLFALLIGLGLFLINLYFSWLVNRRCDQDYQKLCEFADRLKSDVSGINHQVKRMEEIISTFEKKLKGLKETLDNYPPLFVPENKSSSASEQQLTGANALKTFL